MAYSTEDVVDLLDGDISYVDSSDDDLGFEIDEDNSPYFHPQSIHGNVSNKVTYINIII